MLLNSYGSLRLPPDLYLIDGRPTLRLLNMYFPRTGMRKVFFSYYAGNNLRLGPPFSHVPFYEVHFSHRTSRKEAAPVLRGIIELLEITNGTKCRILNKHLLRNN